MGKKKNTPEKKREWSDVNEQIKFVCRGGKVQCPFAMPPIATIIPTANDVMLQDKPFATTGDNNGKVNLNFTGVCSHPSQQKPSSPPPPCKAVISLGKWKNYSDTKINDDNALLVKSTIPCMISGQDLKIVHSGQVSVLSAVGPLMAENIVTTDGVDKYHRHKANDSAESPSVEILAPKEQGVVDVQNDIPIGQANSTPEQEASSTESTDPTLIPEVTLIQWFDSNDTGATEFLVKAKAFVKLTTVNVGDGTNLSIAIRESGSIDNLKSITAKVTNDSAKTEAITIEDAWKNKTLTAVVTDDIKKPENSPNVVIKPQFCDPLDSMQIRRNRGSNLFGRVRNNSTRNHQGYDYYAADGTDIKAVSNGKIDRIVNPSSGDYGIQLVLKIDNSDYYAFYAHLSSISVAAGSIVKQGDVLGQSGCTGNADGFTGDDQHLHFECRTSSSLGTGLTGRESPNNIVATKFDSQDTSKTNQGDVGVKKIDTDGNETLMSVIL